MSSKSRVIVMRINVLNPVSNIVNVAQSIAMVAKFPMIVVLTATVS